MANTYTYPVATPNRLVVVVTGDGTATGLLANATLQAQMVAGPLKNAFDATYADQAAMRLALLYGSPVLIRMWYRTVVADTTAEVNQLAADVDTDATSPTKPEINYQIHDTTGTIAIMEILLVHSLVR